MEFDWEMGEKEEIVGGWLDQLTPNPQPQPVHRIIMTPSLSQYQSEQ